MAALLPPAAAYPATCHPDFKSFSTAIASFAGCAKVDAQKQENASAVATEGKDNVLNGRAMAKNS
jgi:hypothetical protein